MTEMHVLRMDYTTRKRLESRSSENNKKRIKSTSSSLLLVISFRPTDDMMKTETRSPIPFLQMANFSFSSFPFPYSFKEKKGKTTSSPLTPQNTRGRDRQKRVIYHNHARRLFGIAAKAQKSRAASGFLFRQPIATSSIVNHQKSNIWCARGKTHTALLFSIFCYIFDEDFFLRWADKTIAGSTRQGPDKSSSNSCRDKYSGWTKRKKKEKKARTRRRERMRSQRRQTTPPPPPRQAVAAQSSGGGTHMERRGRLPTQGGQQPGTKSSRAQLAPFSSLHKMTGRKKRGTVYIMGHKNNNNK